MSPKILDPLSKIVPIRSNKNFRPCPAIPKKKVILGKPGLPVAKPKKNLTGSTTAAFQYFYQLGTCWFGLIFLSGPKIAKIKTFHSSL